MAAQNVAILKMNIATGLVASAQLLTQAWSEIQKYNQAYVKSGISFSSGDFNNTPLAYIDPTVMGTLITQLNAFVTWANTSGNGDIFFQCAPATPATI